MDTVSKGSKDGPGQAPPLPRPRGAGSDQAEKNGGLLKYFSVGIAPSLS